MTPPTCTAAVLAALLVAGAGLAACAGAPPPTQHPTTEAMPSAPVDIDSLWDFGDPAASEARFRAALPGASPQTRLELQTQIARSYSLRGRTGDAHRVLDEIAPALDAAGPRPNVRAQLERGRTFNSAGAPERAQPLFEAAFSQAQAAGLDALAVDAAHMVAIAERDADASIAWNRRALAMAAASPDPAAQRWRASLLNNLGWALHDGSRAAEALPLFEQAVALRAANGAVGPLRIARWSVARCLRTLGRSEEALAIQRALADELSAAGATDGYVDEELGENLLALERFDDARPHFARAAVVLGADPAFVKNEAARLDRLRGLGAEPTDTPVWLHEQVLAAERAFAHSMAARDHAAFVARLSAHAVFFGRGEPLRGQAAVAAGWRPFFEAPQAPFSWSPDRVEVLGDGTLALSTGPVRNPDGQPIARFNSIWRREAPGVWRVVFDKGEAWKE